MLPALQGDVSVLSHIRSWLRQAPKRGIILLGPSGAGKSQIDLRLRGKPPREDILYTADDENRRLVLQGRRVPLLDTPGDSWHAASSYANVLDALISREPPRVAVIVVAGGYLATSMPELRGTFVRPSSLGQPVANSPQEFVAKCREEEARYLRELKCPCRGACLLPCSGQRLRVGAAGVPRRLWRLGSALS